MRYRVTLDESHADALGRTVDAQTTVTVEAGSVEEANRRAEELYGRTVFPFDTVEVADG